MNKNIVDAYKENNKQLIILVSGLSGSGKTELGENISRDFKIKKIDVKNFYKTDLTESITLPNGKKIINYDSDDAVDWNKLNEEINNNKEKGIVVTSQVFPTDKLNFLADYHIHLKITKQELRDKRMKYMEHHKEKNFDTESEMLRINSVTYPYYLESLKKMKMDKFINVLEMSSDEIYDIVFDTLIKHIENNVYADKYVKKKDTKEKKKIFDYDDTESDTSLKYYSRDPEYIISIDSSE